MNKNNLPKAFEGISECGGASSEEISGLNYMLLSLLAKRTKAYTMGESTSVTVEKAQELYKSICFSINLYIKKTGNINLQKNTDGYAILKKAWNTIENCIEEGKRLYSLALESAIRIDNIAYDDTVAEIGEFFKRYDYRFFAQDIPCSIDYQLCQAVNENMQGIEYINEYLKHICIENTFCKRFSTPLIERLLESYCEDYRGLLINIFEPVAANAIGLAMIDKDVQSLYITENDREQIYKIFVSKTEDEVLKVLTSASESLCENLNITDTAEQEYVKASAIDLLPRIIVGVKNRSLNSVFIPLDNNKESNEFVLEFIDGEVMEDKDLRNLIDELSMCLDTKEKICLVHTNIHSIRDLIEVLNIAFWGDECNCFLRTLDKQTLDLLKQQISFSSTKSATGWERKVLDY